AEYQSRESIVTFRRVTDDRPDGRHVVVFDAATESVRHEPLRRDPNKLRRVAVQRVTQTFEAFEPAAIHQIPGGVDRIAGIGGAPCADGIEVFKSKTDRVHDLV